MNTLLEIHVIILCHTSLELYAVTVAENSVTV